MPSEQVILRPDGPHSPAVELFISAPTIAVDRPAVLFVHGHQEGDRIGGRGIAQQGVLDRFADRNTWVAASVSQPGYGGSDGPPDWCGPASQSAVRTALNFLRQHTHVDATRLVLIGVSRGAVVSSMVATEEPTLRGLILIAGVYDLTSAYPMLPAGIRLNLEAEAGTTPEAFAARSALPIAARIQAATLILHGRSDHRCPPSQAEALALELKKFETDVTLAMVDTGHAIPSHERQPFMMPFLTRVTEA